MFKKMLWIKDSEISLGIYGARRDNKMAVF
jgi:hypothetical protein